MSDEFQDDDIHTRLRQLIFDLKLNASSFAKHIGVSPGVVNNIVAGRRSKPSFEILQKIVETTGVNSLWLITGKGDTFTDTSATVENPNIGSQTNYALSVCQKEVELLKQRITDKDELIASLKAQISMATGSGSSQTA